MTQTAGNPHVQQLDYGRPTLSFWRRHRTALLIILAALLFAAGYIFSNRRTLILRFEAKRRLWEDRRRYYETAAETAPADHLVFDAPIDRRIVDAPVDPPGRWELLWSNRRYSSPNTREPLLFQHEMTTASGMRVLVAVQWDDSTNQRQLIATMLRPGTLSRHPLPYGPFVIFIDDGTLTKPLRLFAGQVDPNDDHHFTIRYQNARESGVLDGRLVEEPGATTYREFGTIRMSRIPDAQADSAPAR